MPERQTISLNGMWQIAFDPDNVGKAEGWPEKFPTVVEEIRVPAVWNEMRPGYVGVAWYRTKFDADQAWADRVVRIKFGAASHYAEVWLNGQPIGAHEGGYTPFVLDPGKALLPGDTNTLVVRVLLPPLTEAANFLEPWEPTAKEGIDGFRLEEVANSKQFYYGNFGGLWQDVDLIATDRVWIADVFIKPNIHDGSITADVTLRNDTGRAAEAPLRLKVEEFVDEETSLDDDLAPEDLAPPAVLADEEHTLELAPGESVHTFTVALEDFLFWSPEAPFVYTLSVSLGGEDTVKEVFGLREFTIEDNQFHLNGEPIVLKAALFQPSYPITLAYPFDREFAEREVRLAKEAGFNCLRMHIKTPPPVTLEFCDKLGMLVQEEPPIGWMKNSPHMTERCLREVREMVLRDRNHPSVVIWGMLNETGNFFGTQDGAQTIKAELCLEARRHDPTRVITDDSGGVEWSKDTAKYLAPGTTEFVPYYDYHPYKPGPVDEAIFEYFRTAGSEGRLNYLSEFGFGGLGDLSTVIEEYAKHGDADYQDKVEMTARFKKLDEGMERFGMYEIFPSFTAFAEAAQHVQALAAQRQIEAMRINPKIGGYCFTQFQDAGFEFGAGMVDAFRRPKVVAGALAVANSPLLLVAWCPRRNVTVGETVRVGLWVVNEVGYEGEVTMEWALLDEDGDPVQKERFGAQLGPGITTLDPVEVALDVQPGHYVFETRLIYMGTVARIARTALSVFEPVSLKGCRTMHVVNPSTELAKALDALGALWSPWSADEVAELIVVPPFETLDAAARAALDAVIEQVKAGAEAVVFELPRVGSDDPSVALGPYMFRVEWSYGLFLGGFHWTRKDALLDGLPSGGLMNDFYRNVYPRNSVMGIEVKPVAGTVMTFGTRLGTDLVRLAHGSGTLTICQFRILGNLTQDPAAAVLLRNLCR
ncbi:MAG: beta galactosidase jelly roll domain-containing protein [Verrucomicrobia bacterium]|nr:beta galactosidase jelly roll domain-containing protein [Verrucomicrobiota bacterium]